MNTILFESSERDGGRIHLPGEDRRAKHVRTVLKPKVGERLRIGELNGLCGDAVVLEVSEQAVGLDIVTLEKDPPPPSSVELVLALPRPKSLRRCLRMIANLGIKSVHLIHSYRVDKSYWAAPALDPENMRTALIEGLEIAGDTVVPNVRLHSLFKPFAQDVAPHLVQNQAFVAHPTDPEKAPIVRTGEHTVVAVGTEGGFIDYEVGLLVEAGFQHWSLGPRIYSVECAVPAVAAHLR